MKVSLNRENLKSKLKEKLLAKMQDRLNNWQHTNSDGSQSPAQWWFDKPVYQGAKVRHQLETGISAFVSGDKLHINLLYTVIDISPPPSEASPVELDELSIE
jgi:hypothetical protein